MKRLFCSTHFLLPLLVLFLQYLQSPAQDIIRHSIIADDEDGDPDKDADGTENDVLVWKSGVVHVVGGPLTTGGKKLIIQGGAIVKFMSDPSGIIGGGNATIEPAVLEIEGAILTSIDDHTVGGNTIEALEAMGVTVGSSSVWHIGRFGADGSYIRGSTLKKGYIVGIGNMEISNNEFLDWTTIAAPLRRNWNYVEDFNVDAEPVIMNNRIIARGGPVIDTQGASATVIGNYIESPKSAAIKIGFGKTSDGQVSPTSGTTIVQNNTIKGDGIRMHGSYFNDYDAIDAAPFSAVISNNKLTNTKVSSYGLDLDVYTNTVAVNNTISNYAMAVRLNTIEDAEDSGVPIAPLSGFAVNGNVFSPTNGIGMKFLGTIYSSNDSTSLKGQLLNSGAFVNAENNDWGHITGPNDPNDKDGQFNDGAGLKVDDLIDYLPFIGQEGTVDVRGNLAVTSPDPEPFFANTTVTFNPTVSFTLNDGAGRVELEIRSDEGDLLYNPKPKAEITAGNGNVDFGDLAIEIPEDISSIIFQAVLYGPAGPGVYTNTKSFTVQYQTTQISIAEFVSEPDAEFIGVLPGTNVNLKFIINYAFTAPLDQPAELSYTLFEGTRTSPKVVKNAILTETISVSSGGEPISRQASVDVPFHSWFTNETDFVVKARLVTSSGRKVETRNRMIPINTEANNIKMPLFAILEKKGESVLRRNFLIPGEVGFYYRFWGNYTITSPDQSGWSIEAELLFYDSAENLLDTQNMYDTEGNTAIISDLNTGTGSTEIKTGVSNVKPVPLQATKAVFAWKLVTNSGIPVYRTVWELPVKDPEQTGSQTVASGGENVDLSPVAVKGNVSGNSSVGTVKGYEFIDPFDVPAPPLSLAKANSEMIKLERYWELTTDLPEDSYSANLIFEYNPGSDFPIGYDINQDSIKIAVYDTLSQSLTILPTFVDKVNRTLGIAVSKINNIYIPVEYSGTAVNVEPAKAIQLPDDFFLHQNYPNPFNPETSIQFSLPRDSFVELTVFDILGRKVKILVNSFKSEGLHTVSWDGTDQNGERVSSGIFLYMLNNDHVTLKKKMILLK